MSILIESMEMPTKGYRLILIHADGTAYTTDGEKTAVSVPEPHGDLVDVEELMEKIACIVPYFIETGNAKAFTDGLSSAYEIVKAAPTIIPASCENPAKSRDNHEIDEAEEGLT